MLKFFRLPFATTGDKTAVPDAVDSNGNVSYSQGYGFDYQRQKTDPAAKNIERDKMNQIFFDITTALAEIQSQGAPDFITPALNGGVAYSYAIGAIVRYSGAVYISLSAANTALPTDAAKWALLTTPPGQIIAVAQNTAPAGYLKANGALVSRTTYAALFAAIGTTFGVGDGSTTFGLPDLRGEFMRGWDDGRGIDSGRVFGSAQTDSNQGHKHVSPVNDTLATLSLQLARGASPSWPYSSASIGVAGCNTVNVNVTNPTSGEDQWLYTGPDVYISGESRPRNIALLMCIKF